MERSTQLCGLRHLLKQGLQEIFVYLKNLINFKYSSLGSKHVMKLKSNIITY